jgi:hypothetical protein
MLQAKNINFQKYFSERELRMESNSKKAEGNLFRRGTRRRRVAWRISNLKSGIANFNVAILNLKFEILSILAGECGRS